MKNWKVQNTKPITSENIVDILLQNRGITKKDSDTFLHPHLDDLTIKNVGIDSKQLAKALKRIKEAVEKKEKIIVFGDYDVDGITGSAILWESLIEMEADSLPYIPHRVDEGYGLSVKGIENVLGKIPDTKLIITVDNGIVANEAVAFANTKNIDVIITDHHLPDEGTAHTQPQAFAIVHTTKLCGAGVALMLSRELKKQDLSAMSANAEIKIPDQAGHDILFDPEHLALAALGTIADLVPLTGSNRIIAKYGIDKLRQTKRTGLLALFKQAGMERHTLGVYEIGHVIAPRLNAAGRMETAMDSLRLICTRDHAKAYTLAEKLGSVNTDRQFVMKEAAAHAVESIKSQVTNPKKLLFISHESYQQGVIGLVAGRLVEEFYRPSIVVSIGETHSKASARSVAGFNIIEFIRSGSDHLVNAGGHPMAAGFTVETAKLALLQEFLEKKAEELLTDDMLIRSLTIDGELSFGQISEDLYYTIHQLAPFGMGNPEPVFHTKGVVVSEARAIGKDARHLKLFLKQDKRILDAIAFGMGDRLVECGEGKSVDVAYTIDINEWNGKKTLQLKIKDMCFEN